MKTTLLLCIGLSIVNAAEKRKASVRTLPAAQNSASISAPLVGWIARESTGTLHAITGVAASSEVSAPLPLGMETSRLVVSPNHEWVLAEAADNGGISAISFEDLTLASATRLSPAMRKIDQVAFSSSGAFALLRYQGRLGIAAPSGMVREWDGTQPTLASLALDDQATLAVGATETGEVVNLESGTLVYRGDVRAMTFVRGTSILLVADRASGAINAVDCTQLTPSYALLAEAIPAGTLRLASARQGGKVYGVLQELSKAFRVSLRDGSIEWIDLPCQPTTLARLRNGDSFLLSAEEGQPAWWLQDSGGVMQAVFAGNAMVEKWEE